MLEFTRPRHRKQRNTAVARQSLFDDSDFANYRFGISLGLVGRSYGQRRLCAQTFSNLQVLSDPRHVKTSELRGPGSFRATFVIMGVEKVECADVVRIALARFGRRARRQIEVDVIDDTRLHVRAQVFGDDIKTTPGLELLDVLAQRNLSRFRSRGRFEVDLHRRAAKLDATARRDRASLLRGGRGLGSHLPGGASRPQAATVVPLVSTTTPRLNTHLRR